MPLALVLHLHPVAASEGRQIEQRSLEHGADLVAHVLLEVCGPRLQLHSGPCTAHDVNIFITARADSA